MGPALERGVALLRSRGMGVPDLPQWMCELDFTQAVHVADPFTVGTLVQQLRAVERRLRRRASSRTALGERWVMQYNTKDVPALPSWASDDETAQRRMVAALARLALGAAIEAALAEATLDVCAPGTESVAAGRLYQDAHLIAIWTSAHVQYVSAVQLGFEEPPVPSVWSVPNAASEFCLSDLFARRFCQRMCPKPTLPLLQILCRCTNPGSRGWDALLDVALKESQATRSVVAGAAVVALSGMHPYLHPALRPPWQLRTSISRTAAHLLTDSEMRTELMSTASATKELVRRLLASSLVATPATQAAFKQINHPIGLLASPPMRAPAKGMEAAMTAFMLAGLDVSDPSQQIGYAAAVTLRFEAGKEDLPVRWDSSWLGKGTSSAHQKVPLVSIAGDLWNVTFRANFLVFWAHSAVHHVRASRLDSIQHRALHSLNSTTKLTLALPETTQLAMQRLALAHPSAGLLTLEEVALHLGLRNVKGTSSNGGTKGPQDTLNALSSAGAEVVAKLLVFARTAWLSEQLIVVDLGENTKKLQLRALFCRLRRTDYSPENSCAEDLPVHATCLHACVECHRVATATSIDIGKPTPTFTELGVSAAMLCTVCVSKEAGSTHIRCAKRSSAALRSALSFEKHADNVRVEAKQPDVDAVRGVLGETATSAVRQAAAADVGVAARVRRDAKNALEQRAQPSACGEHPMLQLSLIGRAVRLWNDWYALCAYCGAMLRVFPHSRFGGEICCRKCDAQMLGMPAPALAERQSLTCRYCMVQSNARSEARWKTVNAPLDVCGENASLPVPSLEL